MEGTRGAAGATAGREGREAGGDRPGSSTAAGDGTPPQVGEDLTPCVHEFGFVENPKYNLNDEQLGALRSISDSVQCPKKHVDVILGPPGTGKTRLIGTTLLELGDNRKVIVFVPTNSEAKELIDVVEKLGGISLKCLRLGTISLLSNKDGVPSDISWLTVQSIADTYCGIFLSWRYFLGEVINHLESYENMYEYHRRKNENLVFANFFKWKFSYAAKDLMDCFKFIRRLPLCMFSGIDDNDIALLLTQLTTMDADLRDIDNDALNFVFGISSPPKVKSEYYHNGVAAAHKLKKHMNLCLQTMKSIKLSLKLKAFGTRDEVKEYLLMQSRTVICTSSSCSNLNSMLSRLNRKDGHLIDLIVADVSSGEPSDDLLDLLFLPEIRNTALTTGITLQDSLSKKLSSEKLASINTKRHQFTKQYQCKERDMTPTDPTQQASSKPLTWTGIPKDMLATIRDQGDRDTCSLHSLLAGTQTLYRLDAAADKPQRTYTIELCVEDMESQYITRTGTEIGCELSDSEKGQSRAEHGLEILKQHGVLGKGKSSNEKVPVAFRISSFRGYHKEDSTEVYNLLKTGKVMIGNFRLSRNFFNLNPRKVYEFNARRPVVNPKNKLVRSHAIMFVGVLPSESSENEIAEQSELVYQNSAGKLFGEGGFGIVKFSSAKGFYQLIL